MVTERKVDVVIIGAGTAGISALREVRESGKSFVLINGGPLGTTCARAGCQPSKLLIHAANAFHERSRFDLFGIQNGAQLKNDIPAALIRVRKACRSLIDDWIDATTPAGDQFIDGYARLLEADLVEVNDIRIRAGRIVIAAGSNPVIPKALKAFGDRILTTDTLFEQKDLPARMAAIGLGPIGLEMGQALARLGVEVTGFGSQTNIAAMDDPVVNQAAIDLFSREMTLYLGEGAQITEEAGGLRVSAGEHSAVVDKILLSAGRSPNLDGFNLEAIGAPVDSRGRPLVNPQTMQLGNLPIFLAGDAAIDRPLLHESVDEGYIAGHNAARKELTAIRRKTPMGIVFTEPNIARAGANFSDLDPETTAVGEIDFSTVQRAMFMGKNYGKLRLYADKNTGRLLGTAMCVTGGEHLAHLLAWCIEQELTVLDLQRMPYYHPTLEEGLANAVEDLARKLDIKAPSPASMTPLNSKKSR